MLRRMIFVFCILLLCGGAMAAGYETVEYESGITAVETAEGWGIINAAGETTVAPSLAEAPNFYGEDYAVVKVGTGVIDEGFSGEDVEKCLFGLLDRDGSLVIPCRYDELYYVQDVQAVRAVLDDHWGLLNLQGETVLPFEYEYIDDFRKNRARVTGRDGENCTVYGVADENGNWILPCRYREIDIGEDCIVAAGWRDASGDGDSGLYGYMDLDGSWTIEPRYSYAKPFDGDYAEAAMLVTGEENDRGTPSFLRFGVINREGEFILPAKYPSVDLNGSVGTITSNSEALHFTIEDGEYYFYYPWDGDARERLPDWADDWSAVVPLDTQPKSYLARWSAGERENPWALLDADGAVTHSAALADIGDFHHGVSRIAADGSFRYEGGVALIQRDGLYGYMNTAGELILPPSLAMADRRFNNDIARVQDADGLYGYLKIDGSWLLEPRFDYAYIFDNGFARVEQNDQCGLINLSGELILPIEYDSLSDISYDKTISAEQNGRETIFRLSQDGAQEVKSIASDIVLEDYMPFMGAKVARLDEEPTLEKRASADHGHPRLDGATALFPVYSAIVEAVYPEKTRYEEDYDDETLVTCTKTNTAYERLIAGETDIIFCAGPSDAQIEAAAQAGVEFELTPFGKEAFVFIVNRDNPLEDISVEEIRGVYSGRIEQWSDLGIENLGDIVAYQRPENSGSQTALQRLMGDTPIMEAPTEHIAGLMDDILETIEYRNLPNAIGYTFRFFCTEMIGSDVKLLCVDGVEPSVENIRNESYPITSTLYMVTRKGEDNPNVQALMDWVLSDQGRELIEKSGYVAVEPEKDASYYPEWALDWDEVHFAAGQPDCWLVQRDKKWGVADVHGNIILPPCMDTIAMGLFTGEYQSFIDGRMEVSIDKKNGVINAGGEFIVPAVYSWMYASEGILRVGQDGKCGYISPDGSEITGLRFDDCGDFRNGRAWVKESGLYGLIDSAGEYVVRPQFETIRVSDSGVFRVQQNGKWGLINAAGKFLIEPEYDAVYPAPQPENAQDRFCIEKDGQTGIADVQGNIIVQPRFQDMGSYFNDYGLLWVKSVGFYGWVNENWEYVIPPIYDYTAESFRCGCVEVGFGDEILYLLPDGSPVTDENHIVPYHEKGLKGYRTIGGEKIAEGSYIYGFDEGWDYGVKGDTLIGRDGKPALPGRYDTIYFNDDGLILAIDEDSFVRFYQPTDAGLAEVESVGYNEDLSAWLLPDGPALAGFSENIDLEWSDDAPLPRLGMGNSEFYPLVAGIAKAAYPESAYAAAGGFEDDSCFEGHPNETWYLSDNGYTGLLDIAFMAEPSQQDIQYFLQEGFLFDFAPIARDALVFFVHPDNPMEDISIEQIRAAYSGEAESWQDLGVELDGEIMAYQNNWAWLYDSVMEVLMGDVQAEESLTTAWGHDNWENLQYRSTANAIGCHSLYYMENLQHADVKILSVNGVYPTAETITDGSYPAAVNLCAAIRANEENPNVIALMQWLQGKQGRELIQKCGYMALEP